MSNSVLEAIIEKLPFGVMLSEPIRDSRGEIIDFCHVLFNKLAQNDLPGLMHWHEGATMWELFPEDAEAGLFDTYVRVCQTGFIHQEIYLSLLLKKSFYSLIEPLGKGVLAMGVPVETLNQLGRSLPKPIGELIAQNQMPDSRNLIASSENSLSLIEMNQLVRRYKREVYEYYAYAFK